MRSKAKLFGMVTLKCDISCDKRGGGGGRFSCLVAGSVVRLEPRRWLLPT